MKLPLLSLFPLVLAAPALAQDDDFTGVSLFGGAHKFNSVTGEDSPLMSTGFSNPFGMTTDGAGTYWATVNNRDLIVVDPRTGFSQFLTTMGTPTARGLEYQMGDTLYVLADPGFGRDDRLYTYDISSDTTTLIGDSNHESLEGIARSPITSQMYAWDITFGLVEMDASNGSTVDVNGLADGTADIQALAFHPATGVLYGSGDGMYEIDTTTGAITLIGAGFPGRSVRGMAYHDYTPSECLLLQSTPLVGGAATTFTVTGAPDGEVIAVIYSLSGGSTSVGIGGYCATLGLGNITPANLIGAGPVVAGSYQVTTPIPAGAQGLLVFVQAMQRDTCPGECVSNILAEVIQ